MQEVVTIEIPVLDGAQTKIPLLLSKWRKKAMKYEYDYNKQVVNLYVFKRGEWNLLVGTDSYEWIKIQQKYKMTVTHEKAANIEKYERMFQDFFRSIDRAYEMLYRED